uniref:Bm8031 n=1 Tax=Brugia malayi TaxID=6279 RepID=A0A1I9G8X3_BRUMA|nr:Bm8031 [Brugia malayi]
MLGFPQKYRANSHDTSVEDLVLRHAHAMLAIYVSVTFLAMQGVGSIPWLRLWSGFYSGFVSRFLFREPVQYCLTPKRLEHRGEVFQPAPGPPLHLQYEYHWDWLQCQLLWPSKAAPPTEEGGQRASH